MTWSITNVRLKRLLVGAVAFFILINLIVLLKNETHRLIWSRPRTNATTKETTNFSTSISDNRKEAGLIASDSTIANLTETDSKNDKFGIAATALRAVSKFKKLGAGKQASQSTADPDPMSQLDELNVGIPFTDGKGYKETIISATMNDDMSWLHQFLPDWHHNVYISDDPDARTKYKLPMNKGREAMIYLTYLIENYHNLPQHMVFCHPKRYQWHNDDPKRDNVRVLQRLKLSNLREKGFVNLRCSWFIGCPHEYTPGHPQIMPERKEGLTQESFTNRQKTEQVWAQAFQELFPSAEIPPLVSAACCSQFGLSREKVLERPLGDYIGYRDWIIKTELSDALSGRSLEYIWHIIFGKPAVHCPSEDKCYCETYGLCEPRTWM